MKSFVSTLARPANLLGKSRQFSCARRQCHPRTMGLCAPLAWLLLFCVFIVPSARGQAFSNPTPIVVPGGTGAYGPADPYPSNITVQGAGTVNGLMVSFFGLSHTFPDDLDIFLVGPGGQNVLLMSDAGFRFAIIGVNLTFADGSPMLPDDSQIESGTYSPSNFGAPGAGDYFPPPAPSGPNGQGPFGATLSIFNGTNPNGTWSLYVHDDTTNDKGAIAAGWSLTIVPEPSTYASLLAGAAVMLPLYLARRWRRSVSPIA